MTPKTDNSAGIPCWACPWAASWTSMLESARGQQPSALPEDAHRRIQRIGVAATSVAGAIWLLALAWVGQIIA